MIPFINSFDSWRRVLFFHNAPLQRLEDFEIVHNRSVAKEIDIEPQPAIHFLKAVQRKKKHLLFTYLCTNRYKQRARPETYIYITK